MWFARVRSFIARHRAIYWAVVGALALTVCGVVVAQSQRVAKARDAWGESVDVWLAAADTPPGTVITVRSQRVPVALRPQHAATGAWPSGAIARQWVSSGEIIVTADVGAGRLPLLPDGWRAVAIPADDTTIAVAVGEHVDVVAAGAVVTEDGVVVDVQPAAVVIGVAADDAPAVASAALDRIAVIVLRPD